MRAPATARRRRGAQARETWLPPVAAKARRSVDCAKRRAAAAPLSMRLPAKNLAHVAVFVGWQNRLAMSVRVGNRVRGDFAHAAVRARLPTLLSVLRRE